MANFKQTSRYASATVSTNRSNNPFIIMRTPLNLAQDSGDTFITVTQEFLNRPDLIAYNCYGDSDLWWVIYDFNQIRDPLFGLKMGQSLRIPAIDRVLTAISQLGS